MIEKEFHIAMIDIYHRAKYEAGYNATRYLQMLQERRGARNGEDSLTHTSCFRWLYGPMGTRQIGPNC